MADRVSRKVTKRQYHSRSYHRYFEDYAEKEVDLGQGKFRIERVYVGSYYRERGTGQMWIFRKVLYVVLYAVSVFCLIHGGTRKLGLNVASTGQYSILPQMISFVALFLFLIPLYYHTTARRKMIIRIYRDAKMKLLKYALVITCILGANFGFSVVYQAIAGQLDQVPSLICILDNLISACAMMAIYLVERKVKHDVLQSTAKRPEFGSIIQY